MCRTRHFCWKGQCATEIQLLNTPDEWQCCYVVKRWRRSGAVRLTRSASHKKTGAWTFATGGGGDSDTRHQDYMVTWQRRRLSMINPLNNMWNIWRKYTNAVDIQIPSKLNNDSVFLHSGRRARSARRPAVQNVSVIAQGHGGGHASPIEAAGQWFY